MTSGVNSIGPSPTGTFLPYQFGSRKTWNGGDGKFEVVNGKRRYKWNNYTVTRVQKQTGELSFKGTYSDYPGGPLYPFNVGVGQSVDEDLVSWNSNDQLTLLSRLSEKVRGHSFNMAVAVGEGSKTMQMAVGTLGTLARSFSALRRGDISTAARQLGVLPQGFKSKSLKVDDIPQRWLELQYGWKPLLNDVYQASMAFQRASSTRRTDRTNASYSKSDSLDLGSGPFKDDFTHRVTRKITYEIEEVLSVQRQIGLLNPLSLVWELVPYSFCVDWFLPLGSYFDNLAQIPKLTGRFLTTTYEEKIGHEYRWDPSPTWPYPSNVNIRPIVSLHTSPSCNTRLVKITREVSGSLQVPLPTIDMGGLEKGTRIWNAAALAHLAFAGYSRRNPGLFERSVPG